MAAPTGRARQSDISLYGRPLGRDIQSAESLDGRPLGRARQSAQRGVQGRSFSPAMHTYWDGCLQPAPVLGVLARRGLEDPRWPPRLAEASQIGDDCVGGRDTLVSQPIALRASFSWREQPVEEEAFRPPTIGWGCGGGVASPTESEEEEAPWAALQGRAQGTDDDEATIGPACWPALREPARWQGRGRGGSLGRPFRGEPRELTMTMTQPPLSRRQPPVEEPEL